MVKFYRIRHDRECLKELVVIMTVEQSLVPLQNQVSLCSLNIAYNVDSSFCTGYSDDVTGQVAYL